MPLTSFMTMNTVMKNLSSGNQLNVDKTSNMGCTFIGVIEHLGDTQIEKNITDDITINAGIRSRENAQPLP